MELCTDLNGSQALESFAKKSSPIKQKAKPKMKMEKPTGSYTAPKFAFASKKKQSGQTQTNQSQKAKVITNPDDFEEAKVPRSGFAVPKARKVGRAGKGPLGDSIFSDMEYISHQTGDSFLNQSISSKKSSIEVKQEEEIFTKKQNNRKRKCE